MSTLHQLAQTLQERRTHPSPRSYTAALVAKGESDDRVIYELADFVYHTLVFLNLRGLRWEEVEAELAQRFK